MATITFTGEACRWQGPATLEIDDVVQVEIRNQSDVTMDFVGGMVVASSGLEDLTRPLETVTRLRVFVAGIEPDAEDEAFLHVDRSGRWGATCIVQDGEVHHPAFLLTVED